MLGILKKELGWDRILEQEGLKYDVLTKIPEEYFEPIIVNRELTDTEVTKLKILLNDGLAIITDFPNLKKIIKDFDCKSTKISYILSDASDIFKNIIAVDLKLSGYKSRLADTGFIASKIPAIYQGKYGNGYIVGLPFDVNHAVCDHRYERKAFYYTSRRFPNELASAVSKGDIRKLVVNCLKKLYAKMQLPYCHVWYYPEKYSSVFAFRVDTDFGPIECLTATFELEKNQETIFTYFVNTKEHYYVLQFQRDFQIHCHVHKVFKDYQRNYDNIKQAKDILEKFGIIPVGFVSPFGLWNENLQRAIEDCDIKYSSEFTLGYDDLPFSSIIYKRKSNVMQIPVHPICIGRLIHAGLSKDKCIKYYKRYFDLQYQANEPMFIYDHPRRIAQFTAVFDEILTMASEYPSVWITTLTAFHQWWEKRLTALKNSQFEISKNKITINTLEQHEQIFYHIILPDQHETFIKIKNGHHRLRRSLYKPIKETKMNDKEIDRYHIQKSNRVRLQMKLYESIDKIWGILEKNI